MSGMQKLFLFFFHSRLCEESGIFIVRVMKSLAIAQLKKTHHGIHHLPVGLQTVVDVNADVISDALLLFLPFISNFLCVQKKIKSKSNLNK